MVTTLSVSAQPVMVRLEVLLVRLSVSMSPVSSASARSSSSGVVVSGAVVTLTVLDGLLPRELTALMARV